MPDSKDDNRPASPEEVLSQHEHAKGLYSGALSHMREVDELLTGVYEVPRDVRDMKGTTVAQPVLPRAIIERVRQMMAVQTAVARVIPSRAGDKEKDNATKKERWLSGALRRTKHESRRDPHRDALFWYLLRGRADYEVRLMPGFANTGLFPIQTFVDDPMSIFPVRGRRGVLWYTKEYTIYARELKRDLEAKNESADFLKQSDPNDEIPVVEYWDETYYAAVARIASEAKLLLSKKHDYGFVPLTEARCMDTPLASAEWASQSIIGPVVDHIKQVYILASKMATGVNLFYYPLLYGVSPNGQPIIVDPNNPGEVQPLAVGTKLEVIPVQVNSSVLQQLMGFFKSEINLMTLPETAFGAEPTNLQSGFAISQVLNAVASAVSDKLPQMELAMGDLYGFWLRLYRDFGVGTGMDFSVPFDYER